MLQYIEINKNLMQIKAKFSQNLSYLSKIFQNNQKKLIIEINHF